MTYVLSVMHPPVDGAKYGKATVTEPVTLIQYACDAAGDKLIESGVPTLKAHAFCNELAQLGTVANVLHEGTGLTFRVDSEGTAPNACPCCGRLVMWSEHAFAGSDDAYCDGCFTWDRNVPQCLPENSAHPNPWGIDSQGAVLCMQVIIDLGDETTDDVRYSRTRANDIYDDETNAEIAWPGLTPDQFIHIDISEIRKEN